MWIRAKGKKDGKTLEVYVKESEFLFNGEKDNFMEKILDIELRQKPIFAGTYAPEDAYEDINIYNVLQNYFFDKLDFIEAEGIKTMESEAGKIY